MTPNHQGSTDWDNAHVHACIHVHVCVCMYVYTRVCMSAHAHLCVYMCLCTHIAEHYYGNRTTKYSYRCSTPHTVSLEPLVSLVVTVGSEPLCRNPLIQTDLQLCPRNPATTLPPISAHRAQLPTSHPICQAQCPSLACPHLTAINPIRAQHVLWIWDWALCT